MWTIAEMLNKEVALKYIVMQSSVCFAISVIV